MPHSTYFVQVCPTCGRRLDVRVEYLGKKVVCQHCSGQFVAWDGAGRLRRDNHAADGDPDAHIGDSHSAGALLRRANELLKRAAAQLERMKQPRPK